MAPIKFEEHIKSQLEERRITPSADLWNQLDDKLEGEETRKTKTLYWWIGVAASLVGVVFMVTLLFGNDKTLETEILVETPVEEQSTPIDTPKEVLKNIQEAVVESNEESVVVSTTVTEQEQTTPVTKNADVEVKKLQKSTPIIKELQTSEMTAVADSQTDVVAKELPKSNTDFETQKAQEVVAEILKLQQENASVSDAEIDALLKAAQKEITRQKIFDESRNTVDADALLQSVEDDLDASFRQRVFDMLKSGYKEVKTALAERNN